MELLCEPPFSLPETFDAVDEAIDHNAELAEAIIAVGLPSFGLDPDDDSFKGQATPNDMDKARSTIRQFYRDWSAEGAPERQAAFSPIFQALESHLPPTEAPHRHVHRILVPGAGLGRLVLDTCLAGYSVEGNEISFHQLLASNYALNYVETANQHSLFPWALNFSNHTTRAHQLRTVTVPDIHPASALEENPSLSQLHYSDRMSMTAGDFCSLYRKPEYGNSFSAVVACFFLDTAPNVLNYLETIRECLMPGGLLINLGPLLWHFEAAPTPSEKAKRSEPVCAAKQMEHDGIGEPGSFELSNEEVIALVSRLGFDIIEQGTAPPTGYIQDSASMLQNIYQPAFWVARKKL